MTSLGTILHKQMCVPFLQCNKEYLIPVISHFMTDEELKWPTENADRRTGFPTVEKIIFSLAIAVKRRASY